MIRFWQGARGIFNLVLGLSLGLLVGWVSWNVFGERLLFGFPQFALEESLWLSLPFVAIGSIVSAIVLVELWRALFTTTPIGTKHNWVTVGAVALVWFTISATGIFLFKSSFA